jgi:cobalt-zinc-cadmium resistance protein CzcA
MRVLIIILFAFSVLSVFAQSERLTVQQAIDIALKNNGSIKAAASEVAQQKQLKKTSFDLPKTDVSLLYGQYNGYSRKDNNITVSQTIPFTTLGSQASLNRSLVASSEMKKVVTETELVYQVKQVYYQLAFVQARYSLLLQQDSIYEGFFKSASLRYKTGETNLLEKTTAETQRNEVMNQLQKSKSDIVIIQTQLKTLLNSETLPEISGTTLIEIESKELPDTSSVYSNPSLAYMRQQVEVAHSVKKVEAAKFAPDLKVGFFTQTLIDVPNLETGRLATGSDRFTGFQVGLAIPLWFVPHQARLKAAEFGKQTAQNNYQYHARTVQGQFQQATQQFEKNKSSLNYYHSSALPNSELILKQSQTSFKAGEIGYAEYLLGLRNAIGIKEGYLQTLNDYNQSIIYIEFLSGNK